MISTNQIPVQFPGLQGQTAFLRPLSIADVNSCVTVESAFPEHERCSEEKFLYRLTQTPDLCLGLFIKNSNSTSTSEEEGLEDGRLIAHVIANRTSSTSVTEGSMAMPENWQSLSRDEIVTVDGQVVGNDSTGSAVAIHSVAVVPGYQGKSVGRDLVKGYVRYLRDTGIVADRLVLIAHGYLVKFSESAGFENRGESECQFAGGGWFNLVLDL